MATLQLINFPKSKMIPKIILLCGDSRTTCHWQPLSSTPPPPGQKLRKPHLRKPCFQPLLEDLHRTPPFGRHPLHLDVF